MTSTPPSEHRSLRFLRAILFAKAGAGVALTLAFFGGWWLQANGLSLGDFQNEMKRGNEPRFTWKAVDHKHWQAQGRVGDTAPRAYEELPETTDGREGNNAGCAPGMVRVKGNFRLGTGGDATGEVERVQDGACTDWISKEFPARCRTFDKDKLAEDLQRLPTRPLDFCMDRFEYPNVLGQNPVIVVTFHEAEAMCRKASKRICNENEWTFACEGEESRPYPYGYTRDSSACVVDRNWRPFTEGALFPRETEKARLELDRLWQAEPSGARNACKSPFGVYDMTGNVDEWTHSSRSTGFSSILKGGYWGPVRARCRPATRAHNEDFVAYQQGFRCCGEAQASVPAPRPTPPVAATPAGTPKAPAAAAPKTDGTNGPTAELSSTDDRNDNRDEVEAIGKARVGLTCAVPRSVGSNDAGGGLGLGLGLGFAGVLRGTRRRRSRG